MSKKNKSKRNKNKKNKNINSINNKSVVNDDITVKKSKIPLIILLAEVVLAISMLILIFNQESFMNLTPFTKDKIVWVIYLIIQAGLAVTILSKKKDDNKWTFHIETMLITVSYLLLG